MTALPLTPSPAHSISAPALRLTTQEGNRQSAPGTSAQCQVPSAWIAISTAAKVLDTSEGALRAKIAREHAPQGLARLMPGETGRKSWHLHTSIDPRLLRAHSPSALARVAGERSAYEAATDRQKSAARLKAQVVIRFRAWREQRGINTLADFPAFASMMLDELGIAVSRRRVYAWCNTAASSTDIESIASELLDRRGGDRRGGSSDSGGSISPEAWGWFESLYCGTKLRIPQCWRRVRDLVEAHNATHPDDLLSWPSPDTVRRRVERDLPPIVRNMARLGEAEWSRRHQPSIEQDPDKWSAGEVWEADHTILDCFVRVYDHSRREWKPRRAWLTAWLDWRSRRLCGWHVSMEHNSTTIALALHRAVIAEGCSIPRLARLDNGSDFQGRIINGITRAAVKRRLKSEEVSVPGAIAVSDESDAEIVERRATQSGILGRLGVEVSFATPYRPNAKGRVERFFRVVHEWFCRSHPTWTGGSTTGRDRADLAESVADVDALPTVEELAREFDGFARSYNVESDRAIDDLGGLSALEFYERHLPARRAVDPDAAAELLLEHSEPRRVTKDGVSLRIGSATLRYGQWCPELMVLVGTSRRVVASIDPLRVNEVRVYELLPGGDRKFLCIAPLNERAGADDLSKRQIAEAMKRQRVARKQVRQRVDAAAALAGPVEQAALRAAEERAVSERRRILAEVPAAPLRISGGERATAEEAREARRATEAAIEMDSIRPVKAPRPSLIDMLADEDVAEAPSGRGGGIDLMDLDEDDDAGATVAPRAPGTIIAECLA